ncbi:MAG: anti-sigma factor [Planctomycetota bacterium]
MDDNSPERDSNPIHQRSNEASNSQLVAGYVLGDLEPDELERVEMMVGDAGFADELARMERTASAVATALAHRNRYSMPNQLRDQIKRDASRFHQRSDDAIRSKQVVAPEREHSRDENQHRSVYRERLAWCVAVAACVLAMLAISVPRRDGSLQIAETQSLSLAEERTRWVQRFPSAVKADWTDGTTPMSVPVSGDVVWDGSSQSGFMRFVGLPVNDPAESQYQLWIVDPQRDDEPIDGGVFNSSSTDEIVIRINAKLNVIEPQAFAITIEKPGGVVVSTQERLPLLARVDAS